MPHHRLPQSASPHGLRGGGFFGKGFTDGGGMGGRGFGMGRKLASADLKLLILGLLAEKPRHGYEIIRDLDERSGGFYVPSPGMVYPALTHLEEIAHATVELDGARKLHHITDRGRSHLLLNRAAADGLFEQFGRVGERMERVRRAMQAEEAEDAADAGLEGQGSMDLLRAKRDLKSALADKRDSSREEQHRVAGILKRAAAEILGH